MNDSIIKGVLKWFLHILGCVPLPLNVIKRNEAAHIYMYEKYIKSICTKKCGNDSMIVLVTIVPVLSIFLKLIVHFRVSLKSPLETTNPPLAGRSGSG